MRSVPMETMRATALSVSSKAQSLVAFAIGVAVASDDEYMAQIESIAHVLAHDAEALRRMVVELVEGADAE